MLEKASDILSLFSTERTELPVLEIAELLGRPRSSVYRILNQMARAGFLDQDAVTGRYRVGIRLANLGELARHSTSLQRVAWPSLCHVGEATGETATLMVVSGKEGVTIDVQESFHPLKIPGHLGGRFPLHATAGGKVLLAWRPRAEITQLLSFPLARLTSTTLTSLPKLEKELEVTKARGYGISAGEWLSDVFAVGAPIRDHRGTVVAALASACPKSRWEPRTIKSMARVVMDAAADVSRSLGYVSRPALRAVP
jgi:IclR family transcriptional regulator, KDG regulon repressor